MFVNGIGYIDCEGQSAETEVAWKKAAEPDYAQIFAPGNLRRMNRMCKMTAWSAQKALEEAGIKTPEAILTATALGSNEDTEKFLRSYLEGENPVPSPTSFIQSTHNAPGGLLAVMLGCTGYNMTYTQRGFSFESALEDAQMLIAEGTENLLCGIVDEITPVVANLLNRMSWKRKGIIAGEGACFFVLGKTPGNECYGKITKLITQYQNTEVFVNECNKSLKEQAEINPDQTLFYCQSPELAALFPYLPSPIVLDAGTMPTISALALAKGLKRLRQEEKTNRIFVIESTDNKYFRLIAAEKNRIN